MGKNTILKMILFNRLLNILSFTNKVRLVEMLYSSTNAVPMKQYVNLESNGA